jgi:hypothetical protein
MKSRNFVLFSSAALLAGAGAFWAARGADAIGVKQARELIQKVAGASLGPDQVQIKKITGGVGGDVVIEAQIETAFRVTKEKGGWRVAEARLGSGQWESFELIEEAVRQEKIRRTNALLRQIAAGIGEYKTDRGQFVEADEFAKLLDLLSPRYLKNIQRFDLWGQELEYRGTANSYRLVSDGPDRKSGTKDDLVVEDGELKTGAEK